MLTPEDIKELKPQFEEIHRNLNVALIKSGEDVPDDAAGHYIVSLALMEELVDEVTEKEGQSIGEALRHALTPLRPSAEKAGLLGGISGGALAAVFTSGGGFGIAAGGTAIGVAGLTGAAVATGGTALAGGAALYLAYKGGSMALETQAGQKVVEQATVAGQKSAEQAKVLGKKAADGIGKMRNVRIRFASDES